MTAGAVDDLGAWDKRDPGHQARRGVPQAADPAEAYREACGDAAAQLYLDDRAEPPPRTAGSCSPTFRRETGGCSIAPWTVT